MSIGAATLEELLSVGDVESTGVVVSVEPLLEHDDIVTAKASTTAEARIFFFTITFSHFS